MPDQRLNPILLIDGDCSLCNASVRLIIKLESRPVLRFAALNAEFGRSIIKQCKSFDSLPDSVVLVDTEGCHTKSRALVRIGEMAGGGLTLLRLAGLVPSRWADAVYDFVARNRKRWFGTAKYCAKIDSRHKHRFLDL